MKGLIRFWRRLRAFFAPIVYQSGPRLSDGELARALAVEIEGAPTFEAVLQLIGDHELTCSETAIGMVGELGLLASEVGGIQALGELRREMIRLREAGRRSEDE